MSSQKECRNIKSTEYVTSNFFDLTLDCKPTHSFMTLSAKIRENLLWFFLDIFQTQLLKTGFMSALPYLAMAIMIQFSGQIADWFLERGILTVTQVRRYFNCGAFVAQTAFMLGAAFAQTLTACIVCLTMAVGLGAFAWCGFSVNHLDIAPQHASVLMGLGNTFATLPGILSPTITSYIVDDKHPVSLAWHLFQKDQNCRYK